ncbi:PTS system sucrose-specific IIB component, Glc family (TC 4.A.1.2.12)/PTS system sucrose-specific IIC component, Glc family (TC 4.A.1.2.12) [Amphibacillus marinus]|uniref:PTS system sucrose-specific IIB component, Glc family (TC 4.A.1.2.12)/PTS system sucrose-specific IIC component, Glc family (TC 4.A.1.2.12) n=1 Tax=Amphibacillus marinus TaxID=872970 RepID=A0A1H8LEH3_9BACI|nr:PTS system sucrose-specific IIB component, Glc family (TC 4.A.1.2.12)/PTS system sucrose-specific IIC component, Glc family (TC 4.A.1.2.12) [Amphibacillus marinus]
MKERNVASEILKYVGGEDNITSVEHCATRLRLVLNDKKKVDDKAIEKIDGVKGLFYSSGQFQIILGTGFVNKVYNEVIKQTQGVENDNKAEVYKNMSLLQKISRTLGDVFLPIIPILVATGLFMGLRGLFLELDFNIPDNLLTLSQVLTDTAFAFLPALVGYSVVKKFGGSPIVGIVVGLMLVAPQLPNAHAVGRGDADPLMLSLFGIPLPVVGFQGSVLPAIVVSIATAKIEQRLRKIVPDFLDLIVTPFLTLLISVVTGLIVIGPIMHVVEGQILSGFEWLMSVPFGIGGAIVGGLQQVVVITGLHHALRALEIDLLASTGANAFNALSSGAIAAQAGAALAVVLKTKNLKKRSLYLTSTFPAFFGITEPAIFGVNLRLVKPFMFGCVGGAAAGLFSSLVGLQANGLAITMIPGMLLYLDGQLLQYMIALLIGLVTAFVLTYVFYKYEDN